MEKRGIFSCAYYIQYYRETRNAYDRLNQRESFGKALVNSCTTSGAHPPSLPLLYLNTVVYRSPALVARVDHLSTSHELLSKGCARYSYRCWVARQGAGYVDVERACALYSTFKLASSSVNIYPAPTMAVPYIRNPNRFRRGLDNVKPSESTYHLAPEYYYHVGRRTKGVGGGGSLFRSSSNGGKSETAGVFLSLIVTFIFLVCDCCCCKKKCQQQHETERSTLDIVQQRPNNNTNSHHLTVNPSAPYASHSQPGGGGRTVYQQPGMPDDRGSTHAPGWG
eukprot:scaffold1772_cov80-Cylindrotheca_fusiformis.AAC.3